MHDVLLCRTDRPLPPDVKRKIAIHCNLDPDAVIAAIDVETVYEVPLSFSSEGLDTLIEKKLSLRLPEGDLGVWDDVVRRVKHPALETTIAIVGKYVGRRIRQEPHRSATARRHREQRPGEPRMGRTPRR